ncbi:MAG: phosphatidylserine decarboxylase family protein [Verrucomicrobiae bacterium]|nr:phosphatidylserine decarboxylase family protein [Verrucomicrobiae bacterium]
MKETNLTWHYAGGLVTGGIVFGVLCLAGAAATALSMPVTAGILALFTLLDALMIAFVFNFYRNPERTCSENDQALVAPADGQVVSIEELEEITFLKTRMKRVAIFLNVFDVHVNRSPCAGLIAQTQYNPGKFLNAMDPQCSVQNENLEWLLTDGEFKVVVRQIAGLIARRIVPWREKGASLVRGERFGMIRFGSRTELYVPLDCRIVCSVGDRVRGGETVIARRP